MPASVQLEQRGGSPLVRLVGDVDMRAVAVHAHELYQHTRDGNVTVDLAAVELVDGPGLTVLLMTLRAASSVQLINIPPAVRTLLDVSSSVEVLRVDAA